MATIDLRINNVAVTPVGELSVQLGDHITRNDGISFSTVRGVPVAPFDSVNLIARDGHDNIRSFGAFTVNDVQTNEPQVTASRSRDVGTDASILNAIVNAAKGIPSNPSRSAFLTRNPYETDFSLAGIAREAIVGKTRVSDAIQAARRQLLHVYRTSTGSYGIKRVEQVLPDYQASLGADDSIREVAKSELIGTISGDGIPAFLRGDVTPASVRDALRHYRATYRRTSDDRLKTTPADDDAIAIPGEYKSLVLAGDALARHILNERIHASKLKLTLRTDLSLTSGDIIEYDGFDWVILSVAHRFLDQSTAIDIERADLIDDEAIKTVYETVKEYLLPPRPTGLAQGVIEGSTTQAVWEEPSQDNVDGYVLRRYVNDAIGSSTYEPWVGVNDDAQSYITQIPISTAKEHVLVNCPAGRAFPLVVQAYNAFGLSPPATLLPYDATRALSPIKGRDLSLQAVYDDEDILRLRSYNGWPVLPTQSIATGLSDYQDAQQNVDWLRLVASGRVFEKTEDDFPEVDDRDKAANIVVTGDSTFAVSVGGGITAISGLALAGLGNLSGAATLSCSSVCLGMTKAVIAGNVLAPLGTPIEVIATAQLAPRAPTVFTPAALAGNKLLVGIGASRFGGVAVAGLRAFAIGTGPIGLALNAATLPAHLIFSEAVSRDGILLQFNAEPSGWGFERVELQWQWRRRFNGIHTVNSAGRDVPDTHWLPPNDGSYNFTSGQQNTFGDISGANDIAEMDWLNKDLSPTDAELEAVARAEVGRDLTVDDNRAELEVLWRMRQPSQTFVHKASQLSPPPPGIRPEDIRFRFRIVVDSLPDSPKTEAWTARTAVTREQAEAAGDLDDAGIELARNPARNRYRASEWHTTDWLPYNRTWATAFNASAPPLAPQQPARPTIQPPLL